jgi:hypothetical protein
MTASVAIPEGAHLGACTGEFVWCRQQLDLCAARELHERVANAVCVIAPGLQRKAEATKRRALVALSAPAPRSAAVLHPVLQEACVVDEQPAAADFRVTLACPSLPVERRAVSPSLPQGIDVHDRKRAVSLL